MNKWFTRYLHGVENNVEDDARAWIVRENDKRDNPTSYEDYPNPNAEPVTLYINSGAPKVGTLSTAELDDKGTETLYDDASIAGTELATADESKHRLLYVTPTLTNDLHISGVSEITVSLSSNTPAANLSVWLVSLPWNDAKKAKITDNIITRGWADPQNYKSISKGEALKKGKFYDVTFSLQPDDQIIPKGQQIGLMIFSSDKEFTLHPKPGTELTIDLDKTSLNLPIIGGKDAFEKAFKK